MVFAAFLSWSCSATSHTNPASNNHRAGAAVSFAKKIKASRWEDPAEPKPSLHGTYQKITAERRESQTPSQRHNVGLVRSLKSLNVGLICSYSYLFCLLWMGSFACWLLANQSMKSLNHPFSFQASSHLRWIRGNDRPHVYLMQWGSFSGWCLVMSKWAQDGHLLTKSLANEQNLLGWKEINPPNILHKLGVIPNYKHHFKTA